MEQLALRQHQNMVWTYDDAGAMGHAHLRMEHKRGRCHLDKVWPDRPVDEKEVDIVQAQSVQGTAESRPDLLILEMVEVNLSRDEELLTRQASFDSRRQSCPNLGFVSCMVDMSAPCANRSDAPWVQQAWDRGSHQTDMGHSQLTIHHSSIKVPVS